jgi:hypothetical protein
MAMNIVVPVEEPAKYLSRLLDAYKSIGYLRPILHRFEVALRKWVIVAGVRTRVALDDAHIREQLRYRYAYHLAAVIGMDRKLARRDPLASDCILQKHFCYLGAGLCADTPANNAAAEDIDHHIEVVVGPPPGPLELGYIPAPHLVRPGGKELRAGSGAMPTQLATLIDFTSFPQ